MSTISEKYLEKEKILKKRKEKILESEEYLDWLEEYTEIKEKFTSDDSNDENVQSLEALYLLVEEYAEENYIFPSKTSFGNYYTVKYNGINYNIGYMAGQGIFFYCERTTEENLLDFKDILKGKKQPRAELIKLKLNKLTLLVSELSLTFPEEKLVREVSKVYQKKQKSERNVKWSNKEKMEN